MKGKRDRAPGANAEGDSGPKRVTFTLEEDLVRRVTPKIDGYGKSSAYFNAAVRALEFPAFRLGTSETAEDAARSLAMFIESATEEIIFVGSTLPIIGPPCNERLRSKVSSGVRLTLITIDPELPPDDPVYVVLRRQLTEDQFVEDRRQHVQELVALFDQLRPLGSQSGARVQIFGCGELPMCGLAIVDNGITGRAKMRVNLYDSLSTHRRSPFLDIDPASTDGSDAYRRLYHYYEMLLRRSPDLAARKDREQPPVSH